MPNPYRDQRPAPKAKAVRHKVEREWDRLEDEWRQTLAKARRSAVQTRGKFENEAREFHARLRFSLEQAASEIKTSVERAKGRVKSTRHRLEGEARVSAVKLKISVAQVRTRAKRAADRIEDEARFLRTWLESPLKTGAVTPSSPELAREMARHVDPDRPGLVIELGPGTGPVTEALIRRGVPPERLLLVEYDPDFCRLLRARYPAATVVQGDAYAIEATLRGHARAAVAAVVSSLPLMTRPPEERIRLLRQCFNLLVKGAPFIQFTYAAASPIPLRIGGFMANASKRIWKNIPPARVWVYRQA
ncbi:MAG: methyltransferase domain-containing protein [Rhizobiales bacterium]|nr:methyltransferase domain-containing protein [Hyphomicrobiales bacterium]